MNVPGLGCAGSVRGVQRQRVAFQYDDPLEMIGERPRRRQTADTGADDDSPLADRGGRHSLSPVIVVRPRRSTKHIASAKKLVHQFQE
jgi:hypothetical protein